MNIVRLEILDEKGFVKEEFKALIEEKSNNQITLIIGDKEYYFLSDGEMFLNKRPHDAFVVCYANPLVGDKGNALYYTCRARNDKDAIRQAMLNTEFLGYINMQNYDKKYLTAYKPKIYDKQDIGKVRYYEGDPRL